MVNGIPGPEDMLKVQLREQEQALREAGVQLAAAQAQATVLFQMLTASAVAYGTPVEGEAEQFQLEIPLEAKAKAETGRIGLAVLAVEGVEGPVIQVTLETAPEPEQMKPVLLGADGRIPQ